MIGTILAFGFLCGIIGLPIALGILLAEEHSQRAKEKADAELEKFKSDNNID
ncbi:hypothetical protein ZZ1p0044 [Acinetobacter phage ZZ1]|uniref:Uncharacterized protein n=1 Tax=Acinetobacter phage ZZ1 TaxID=1049283 RepID=W0B0S2_9CAUD|nr:hypothetical protein ZZ1p0044 [Acinetobacter phage ZZ1]AHE63465.1 hypothetical protein ZZ1p0044 [Acinetobacter phage ZZ1]